MKNKSYLYPIGVIGFFVALVIWLEPTPYRYTQPPPHTFSEESATPSSPTLEQRETFQINTPNPRRHDSEQIEITVPISPQTILAPDSNTVAEYLEDEQIAQAKEKEMTLFDENTIRPVDLDLWQPLPSPPTNAPNQAKMANLAANQWIEMDDLGLSQLRVGDKFNLSDPRGGQTPVIVGKKEYLQNQAVNWTLYNTQGERIGSLTQTPNFTEGEYTTDDQKQYFLRSKNGQGWIAEKEDLLKNSRDKFRRPSIDTK